MKSKLDHIWGEQPSTGANPQLEQQVNQIDNRLTSLSNIAAKTNIDNTFTTHQTIQGYVKNSAGLYKDGTTQNIVSIKNQSSKEANIIFIQDSTGFRNYCNFHIKHRYGNQTDAQAISLFSIETRNTDVGIFIGAESNKISFKNETTLDNVKTPTGNLQAANKAYVDSKVPEWTILKNQTLNFKTTNLQWNAPDAFNEPGIYEFRIEITNGNFNYIVNAELPIADVTKTYTNGLNFYEYQVSTTNTIQALPDTAICFFYNNKWIRIAKYGQNHPEANTTIKIFYRKK